VEAWQGAILAAAVGGILSALGVTWAARRSAGAVERAAERGARAAVEAAGLTAGATVDAAEIARTAAHETDIRHDRRESVRPLLQVAATREGIARHVLGAIHWGVWTTQDIDRFIFQLGHVAPLEDRHRYLGIQHAEFQAAVQAYWNADAHLSAELFMLWATAKENELTPEQREILRIHDVDLAGVKRQYEDAFAELHQAVVTLHQGAEAYIAGQ
jgi:hypothetical protein